MRGAVIAGLVLALAAPLPAAAEFVAREKSFKCLFDGRHVEGRKFFIFNRNRKRLHNALRVAQRNEPGKRYPVGTILQLLPFEAMVKRGGGFNPAGDGWEFFRLAVTPQATRIVQRGGAEVANVAGSCQGCHGVAAGFDFVCEGHGAQALPLSDDTIRALQASDPRCK